MTFLQLLFAVLLLLGNAFFVGAEFALVSVRRSQVEPLAATHRRARTVIAGLENLSMMLAAAQFGITVCSLALGAVLMGITFWSARRGYDDRASGTRDTVDDRDA